MKFAAQVTYLFLFCLACPSWGFELGEKLAGHESFIGDIGGIPVVVENLTYGPTATTMRTRYFIRRFCGSKKIEIVSAILNLPEAITLSLKNGLRLHGTNRKVLYRGIPSTELRFPATHLFGKGGPLLLRASADPRFVLSAAASGEDCSFMGAYPSFINVAFEPDSLGKLEEWVKRNDAHWDEGDSKQYDNLRTISVAVGTEVKAEELLQKEAWVIHTARVQMPAGPDMAIVDFPSGTLIKDDSTQGTILETFRSALQSWFPSANVDSDHFRASGQGFQYEWEIAGPAITVLPTGREFKNHWLKTTVNLVLYPTGFRKSYEVNRVTIDISDGYLPRWPDDKGEVPPDPLIHEAHLDDVADSKFRSFEVLRRLQRSIAAEFQRTWKGSIFN